VTTWILIIVLLIGEDVIVMESEKRYDKEECMEYGSRGIYQDIPGLIELRMAGQARVYCSPVVEVSA
jgi:hypothetical protein